MRQGIKSEHWNDAQGQPAGGTTYGVGLTIGWQHGALGRGAERKEPNGAFVEDVIEAARDRPEYYQGSQFQCQENADAIKYLVLALSVLDARTRDREARAVEGTHGR